MDWKTIKRGAKKFWVFIWESDSPWSWLANIILAFILIKFIIYPVLGLVLATSHPIVAVVSGSMEHKTVPPCLEKNSWGNCIAYGKDSYELCGNVYIEKQRVNYDFFWKECGPWYENHESIKKEQFADFPMKNGFNTGDLIILRGSEPENIKGGDINVYSSASKSDPRIHRLLASTQKASKD